MSTRDPIGDLVLLARSAAEAGVDWHTRLNRDWLPRTMAATPRSALLSALGEWRGEPLDDASDVAGRLEAAVLAALAEQGYD